MFYTGMANFWNEKGVNYSDITGFCMEVKKHLHRGCMHIIISKEKKNTPTIATVFSVHLLGLYDGDILQQVPQHLFLYRSLPGLGFLFFFFLWTKCCMPWFHWHDFPIRQKLSVPSVGAAKKLSKELCLCKVHQAVCFLQETDSCISRCGFLAWQENASTSRSICI